MATAAIFESSAEQRSHSPIFRAPSPRSFSSSPNKTSFLSDFERRDSYTSSSFESLPQLHMGDCSNFSSLPATPSTSTSFDEDDGEFRFPDYDSVSRKSTDDEDAPETTTEITQSSNSPLPTPTCDDSQIKQAPSQHVDYLSHNWREEDIWSSWRHIVSQRRVYGQRSRLENASWRTWAKSKYRLRTIPPESLNWLKESDVTWLYGPLKSAQSHPVTSDTPNAQSRLSKSGSFVNKKPILKKRSVSEVMLQKSLSTSSLLKQAAASVQAQQTKSPRGGLQRTSSDLSLSANVLSQTPHIEEFDYFSTRLSSATDETPSDTKEKHIRFDEVVEQCVAINPKPPAFGDEDDGEVEDDPPNSSLSESSSDEGPLMMKGRSRNLPLRNQAGRLSRTNSSSGKMIETIPATTLKYRTDSPDITEEQQPQHHTFGQGWGTNVLSHSPSQETLRPSRPSRNFLLAEDDDDDDEESETSASWSFGASNPKSSLGASAGPSSSASYFNPSDGYEGMEGMRRTESGMLMPIDEDEDDLVAAGLFGRVSETVNTVKDIGWVLWNSFSTRRDS